MIDHESRLKELLTTFPFAFARLFAPELARDIAPASLLVLPAAAFPDLLRRDEWRPVVVTRAAWRGRAVEILVHVVTESGDRAGVAERMYRYTAALWLTHQLPVYPVALLSFDRPRVRQPDRFEAQAPGLGGVRFRYRVVQLNRLEWRSFLRRPNPVAAALMARMAMGPGDRPLVKAACLRMLVGLRLPTGQVRLLSGFVDTCLRLQGKEQARFEKQVEACGPRTRAKVVEIVREASVAERQDARLAKRRDAMAQEVLALLGRRAGHLPAAVERKVRGLGMEELQTLFTVALLNPVSVRDLRRCLASRG